MKPYSNNYIVEDVARNYKVRIANKMRKYL